MDELKARFKAAVIKKHGVLQQPFLCRSSDKKINPSTREMLWAAIILEDWQGVEDVKAIILTELLDQGENIDEVKEKESEFTAELLALSSNEKLSLILKKLC